MRQVEWVGPGLLAGALPVLLLADLATDDDGPAAAFVLVGAALLWRWRRGKRTGTPAVAAGQVRATLAAAPRNEIAAVRALRDAVPGLGLLQAVELVRAERGAEPLRKRFPDVLSDCN